MANQEFHSQGGHHAFMLFPEAYTTALDAFLSELTAGTAQPGAKRGSGGAA